MANPQINLFTHRPQRRYELLVIAVHCSRVQFGTVRGSVVPCSALYYGKNIWPYFNSQKDNAVNKKKFKRVNRLNIQNN